MAVYTCYDMIADCRAGKDAGWEYLITNFVPAVRRLLRHYAPERDTDEEIKTYLTALRDDSDSPIRVLNASTGREFLFGLRDHLVRWASAQADVEDTVDIERFAAALAELTVVERQIAWYAVLGYDADAAGAIMRVSPSTSLLVIERAAALLADETPGISLQGQSAALQAAARSLELEKEVALSEYLHFIDGQLGWSSRKDVEMALERSWREVDRSCRIREADDATRDTEPLTVEEGAVLLSSIGMAPKQKSFWQKVFTS
jgi:hypothetical protein